MAELLTREQAKSLVDRVLARSQSEGCQVRVVSIMEGNTRFAWGFAGGLKYKLGPQVGIRADVRGYGTQTDLVETGWGCGYYDCGVVSYEKTIWQGDATAGVFIAF